MSLVVYLAAAMLLLAMAVKLRRPRTALRDPLIRSVCTAILLSALTFILAAPHTIAAVNDATGIPNFGAPLTYSVLSAMSCSLMVVLLHWRGGPVERIRRTARACVAAYGLLIAAIVVLFACADAPVERLSDLDTHYANTPYMREMILLYLLGHSVSELVLLAWCWSWQREVSGVLRTGLRLIAVGCLLDVVGFQATKYVAVGARWHGYDWDFLSTFVAPPLASLGALTCAVGFILPRVGPAVAAVATALRDHRRLAPLWGEVSALATAPKPPTAWWHSPQERLHQREVSIHDGLLVLAPHLDDGVRLAARTTALAQGLGEHDARVVAEAAMLADAARRARNGAPPQETPSPYQLYATEAADPSALVELARALATSPVATAAREGTLSLPTANPEGSLSLPTAAREGPRTLDAAASEGSLSLPTAASEGPRTLDAPARTPQDRTHHAP
ncbi:MAB_1171c family putative transporter [Streptomyces sp. CC228A]|uniref:MAB_1171c family putative transporter n=1 Tax=Streptomyces sp. CC228A TaxID=2898186 RepID=UPI001F3A029F|nr:MAB_1171c family putative transporter [Streptomyces sp. CC228A]